MCRYLAMYPVTQTSSILTNLTTLAASAMALAVPGLLILRLPEMYMGKVFSAAGTSSYGV